MTTRPAPPADWLRAAVVARAAALGIGNNDLARRAGVSPAHVSDFLRGRKDMGSSRLCRVLDALGLTVAAATPPPTSPGRSGPPRP